MSIFEPMERVLVVAPHPDDEVLGCGGTIARLAAEGCDVQVAIVTRGMPPHYLAEDVELLRSEALEAHALLKVSKTHFLDFPAAGLDQVPQTALNHGLETLIEEIDPDTVFLPFVGDIHVDHQRIFSSGLVAARPKQESFPSRVLAYETLSETNWSAPYLAPGFSPNMFIGIEGYLDVKLEAFKLYASQCREFPHERSVEAIAALAKLRGANVHKSAAEAFILVRGVG